MGYWTNTLKTTALIAILTALVLWIGRFFGGTVGLIFAFIFVVLFNGLMYWFSDKIVLWMYQAKKLPKTHKVVHMVHELAKKANMPAMPQVYIVENMTPNAFATGRSPKHSAVAVTTGILNILTDAELKGVLAHEISHITNRDTLISTIAGVLAGLIAYAADMARWTAIFSSSDDENNTGGLIGVLALSILAPLVAIIIQMAISRAREYMADESGAHLVKDAKSLASALKKLESANKHHLLDNKTSHAATSSLFIVNPFRGNFIFEMFSTHPPMDKRIQKLHEIEKKL